MAGRRWRAQQRQLACYRGAISDAQLAQMNADDAPLEQLPDWTEYQAAKRQAADEPIWLEGA